MYLVELLEKCKSTYISQARAGMRRDGMPEEVISDALSQVEAVLEDYNQDLLRAFGENIVVKTPKPYGKA